MLGTTAVCALISAADATLMPFLTVYLRNLGLSPIECGLLRALQTLLSILSVPCWKSNSETAGRKKVTIAFSTIVCVVLYVCLIFIPSTSHHHRHVDCSIELRPEFRRENESVESLTMPDDLDFNVTTSSEHVSSEDIGEVLKLISNVSYKSNKEFRRKVLNRIQGEENKPGVRKALFFVILLLLVSAGFLAYPTRLLRKEINSKTTISEHISASISVLVTGFLIVLVPCAFLINNNGTVIHFYAYSVLMLAVIVCIIFTSLTNVERKVEHQSNSTTEGLEFNSAIIFIALYVLGGYWNAVVYDYRLWLAEEYDANELILSIIIVTGLQSRILASYVCDIFLRKYGLLVPLLISYVLYSIGLLGTSLITSCWVLVPIQCIYGFAYEILGSALVKSGRNVPDHMYVREAVLPVGFSLGTFASSVLIHYQGISEMYRYQSCFCLVVLMIICAKSFFLMYQEKANAISYTTLRSNKTVLHINVEAKDPVELREL